MREPDLEILVALTLTSKDQVDLARACTTCVSTSSAGSRLAKFGGLHRKNGGNTSIICVKMLPRSKISL